MRGVSKVSNALATEAIEGVVELGFAEQECIVLSANLAFVSEVERDTVAQRSGNEWSRLGINGQIEDPRLVHGYSIATAWAAGLLVVAAVWQEYSSTWANQNRTLEIMVAPREVP
ncbi:MAG: hypothetical protein ACREQ5_18895 [Candidatus Dormibacteria bacterium]